MAHEPPRRNRPIGNNPGNTGVHGNNQGANVNASPFGAFGWSRTGSEQVRDILHVVFKRKRLIGFLFLAVALPGLMVTLLRKPSYLASAKVMISTQRSDPTVQPT